MDTDENIQCALYVPLNFLLICFQIKKIGGGSERRKEGNSGDSLINPLCPQAENYESSRCLSTTNDLIIIS